MTTHVPPQPRKALGSLQAMLRNHRRVLSREQGTGMHGEPPGERLGATLEQHRAAFKMAVRDQPGASAAHSISISSDEVAVQEVDKVLESTQGRSSREGVRSLLCLNFSLQQAACSKVESCINAGLIDVLQRKLSDSLPCTTHLSAGDQAARLQLLSRCAIAKGKHVVRYEDHESACQLLQLLAEQNDPGIKAVLRLAPVSTGSTPAAECDKAGAGPGSSRTESAKGAGSSKAAAELPPPQWQASAEVFKGVTETECGGEWEITMDAGGIFIPAQLRIQLVAFNTQIPHGDFFDRLAALDHELSKNWDTVAIEVPSSGGS